MKTPFAQRRSFSRKINNGFTLIEMLIAMFIFAIVGILAAMSLHSIIHAHEKLKKTDQQLFQLQMTMTLLRRDISAVINRKVRNDNGDASPAFFASGATDITFTRTAPLNMRRVGYVLQNNNFLRLTWSSLDQAPGAKPESQIMVRDVKSIDWQFIDDKNNALTIWPPSVGSNIQIENQSKLPKVVLMVMTLKNNEVIQGVFPIPARGNDAA
ncbi:MAG: type II secretion system minor pseudopilin GspJ [Gammaproteobacteria bacterium]|nr:type II secretion system minor pseudopilin GspJ [Gammaproteobacteria bacterium]